MANKKMTLEEKLEEAAVKDVPYEIPENWMWTKLGTILKVSSGKGLTAKDMNTEGDIPVYGGNGVTGYHDQAIYDTSKLIIGRVGAQCGNVHITSFPCWITDNALVVEYKEKVIKEKYLYHALKELNLGSYSTSSAQPVISGTKIYNIAIPLPPLKEQERIVDKIQSLFEKLDKTKELIEEARDDFEKRKSAILEKAFRGELTKEWRSKKNIEYKDSWKSGIFEDLCVLSRGFDLPSRLRVEGEYLLVSSSGSIDTHNEAKMRAPGVVTGRSGSIGKVFYIEKDFWPLNTTLYVKEFKGNYEKYVYYYLSKFDFKKYSSSTAVPTLNRNNFKCVSIMFPCLEEQKEIVRILDDLLEQESKIEELTKLDEQIELIKKSILAKAFRGQLGTNSEEDESALEVLKEILNT